MSLNIQGLQKTTLLDYPGHVAATIFLGGCNFKCVFCHNMDIVNTNNAPLYSEQDILSFLKKRAGILDGVCITGGEPTLYKDLPEFIKEIKNLDLLVKLDTNGTNPEMVEYLINNSLIDYIAMDIKSSPDKYDEICGFSNNANNNNDLDSHNNTFSHKINKDALKKSVHLIINSNIPYEFRTTIVKEYHDIDTMTKIGEMLNGSENYFLQSFVDSDYVPNHDLHPCDIDTLNDFVNVLKPFIKNVSVRGEE